MLLRCGMKYFTVLHQHLSLPSMKPDTPFPELDSRWVIKNQVPRNCIFCKQYLIFYTLQVLLKFYLQLRNIKLKIACSNFEIPQDGDMTPCKRANIFTNFPIKKSKTNVIFLTSQDINKSISGLKITDRCAKKVLSPPICY